MTAISGFMVLRDAEVQGYPFVEATTAALGVCDELLISDGFSRDRTWEALIAVRDAFGDRVRLFRDRWPGDANHGRILAEATNVVRRRCSGEWCLSVQANEILHEDSFATLRDLGPGHPDVEIFALPYLTLMGCDLAAPPDIRRRLFRNIPDIVAIGDAFECASVIPVRRVPTQHVELPEPIYRYRAPTPLGYLEKLRRIRPRTPVWDAELALAERALASAEGADDPVDTFWRLVREYLAADEWLDTTANAIALRGQLDPVPGWPAAARHLRGRWRPSLDDSLAWLGRQELVCA